MASPARSHGRQVNVLQLVALLMALVLVAGVGGILAGGMLIPVAAGAKTLTDSTVQVFDDLPSELEPGPLSQQSVIYANDGKTVLARYWVENRIVVPLESVSQHMQDAVIATEDKRFWEHGGIDIEGTARAAVNNFTGSDVQGASTLTQQYVKNVLIEQASRDNDQLGVLEAHEDSYERKLREAKLAISLEQRMSKTDILEGYLNISQFGVGVYGVETASRYLFGKHAKDLSIVEAATIAGVTKAPGTYDPTVNPEKAKGRRDTVLTLMYQQGYISKKDYDAARKTTIAETLDVHPVEAGCQASQTYAFFCDYVTKEITLRSEFGETAADRQQLLYRGGLKIVTTLDPKMQKAADKQIKAAVPPKDPSGLEAAMATVEPGTGKILAMAQNRTYDATGSPAKGATSVNYAADPAHGASKGFQVGSTFKPFVLAEWLRSGHTLSETVSANKVSRVVGTFKTPCVGSLGGDVWAPANSEGNQGGQMPVLKATYNSVNTAFASMGFELNLCDVRDMAWNMGFRPTTKAPQVTLTKPTEGDIDVVAPMVIGTQASSPVQQAAAFATLASNGTYCSPIAITKVTDADGKDYAVPESDCDDNALDPRIAATVVYAMKNVLTIGTAAGNGLSDGRDAAGKTGTTNGSAQTWFNGFTPELSTSIWVGSAEGDSEDHLYDTVVDGRFIGTLYGSSVAAPAWKKYMDSIISDVPAGTFPAPDPAMVGQVKSTPKAPSSSSSGKDDSSKDSSKKSDESENDSGKDGGGDGGGKDSGSDD